LGIFPLETKAFSYDFNVLLCKENHDVHIIDTMTLKKHRSLSEHTEIVTSLVLFKVNIPGMAKLRKKRLVFHLFLRQNNKALG
jgi:hypothetical protein